MRAVVQRVTESSVTVDGQITGATDEGLVVLIGVEEGDTDKDAGYIADKVSGLRIFEDENEKMNLSVKDVGGSILAISQFTLLGDVRKGKRPSFITAEDPEIANRLYQQVCENIRNQGIKVETGIFPAHMLVKINNNGQVTIMLDSRKTF
ncbi:MAG: D-aminoacyl-tRNA deacylase [Eubacteriales bacterium]|nr:D-aminoacyl-tRNA deacylase [Eubacteriales bacterium]